MIIVGINQSQYQQDFEEKMQELVGLVEAAGAQVVSQVTQNLSRAHPATLIGPGKAEDIAQLVIEQQADGVVFLSELSGSQIRNLEELLGAKVLDRTNLILDIFASRATSREGKLQVKLAQLQYRLPRLVGYRNYLSRLGGGIGTRGPGEQKLEVDRRHILREIKNIRKQLKKSTQHRQRTRRQRLKSTLPLVALIGYTNAGKSTITNQLLAHSQQSEGKEVLTKDMLFASLDPSIRLVKIDESFQFLLADTVGFVSDLPTLLVESFQSTLEEIEYADLIVIVVDGSSRSVQHQLETTEDILNQLQVGDTPQLIVYNKADLMADILVPENGKHHLHLSALNDGDIRILIDRLRLMLHGDLNK